MVYKVNELFYSIIGEGEWTGIPAFFIRLAGCNLNCNFCDTKYKEGHETTAEEILRLAKMHPARKVVITGGEPCLQELKGLTDAFRKEFKIHLETNGTIKPDSLDIDWIAVSPKPGSKIDPFTLTYASEVKFLCGTQIPGWEKYMERLLPNVGTGYKWLLPIADGYDFNPTNMSMALDYIKSNPEKRIKYCTQIHKVLGIK